MKELFSSDAPAIVNSNRILYTASSFARSTLLHLQEIGEFEAKRSHTSSRSNLRKGLRCGERGLHITMWWSFQMGKSSCCQESFRNHLRYQRIPFKWWKKYQQSSDSRIMRTFQCFGWLWENPRLRAIGLPCCTAFLCRGLKADFGVSGRDDEAVSRNRGYYSQTMSFTLADFR